MIRLQWMTSVAFGGLLDWGKVATQKRIGVFFDPDGRGDSGLPGLAKPSNLEEPPLQQLIVWLHLKRKFQVGLSIFMGTINLGEVRQIAEFLQRVPHLHGRAFKHAAAPAGEK